MEKRTGVAVQWKPIAVGVLTSVGVGLLLSAILTWLVLGGNLRQDRVEYGMVVIRVLAMLAGGVLAAARSKTRRVVSGVASCLGYFLLLLAGTALIFGGRYQGIGSALGTAALAAAVVALWGMKQQKGGKRKRVKMRYR